MQPIPNRAASLVRILGFEDMVRESALCTAECFPASLPVIQQEAPLMSLSQSLQCQPLVTQGLGCHVPMFLLPISCISAFSGLPFPPRQHASVGYQILCRITRK